MSGGVEGNPHARTAPNNTGRLDALYEAGCDDGLVSRSHGVQHVDFAREAATVEEAVSSAIDDVETRPGVEVVQAAV